MKIAVEGCAHGEIDKIYETIAALEKKNDIKVDVLICCGDFQSTRNSDDLNSMAVPPKYRAMGSFHMYYAGEKVAPILTIFIGGNHEASKYLQEVPYGGWVAPNIYYLGYSGIINIGGIRIAGLSGIYNARDFHKGRFEAPPYSEQTKRSVYHVRNLDVFRMKQVKSQIDIFLSHDWPLGIYNYGDINQLLKEKHYFENDIAEEKLGSPANQELLDKLKPKYWFASHLHVKFAAIVPHKDESGNVISNTKFLALDKCLPRRQFLQVLDIEHDKSKQITVEHDLEWLAILHYTNHLISVDPSNNFLPGPGDDERWIFTPTESEKEFVMRKMGGELKVPCNFVPTVQSNSNQSPTTPSKKYQGLQSNIQTEEFCKKLGIDDPLMLLLDKKDNMFSSPCPVTPDDAEMSSFIDSEISGFCSGSEENEKSIYEEKLKEINSTSVSFKSMKLPPPKYEESQVELEPSEMSLKDNSLFFIDDGSKRCHDSTTKTDNCNSQSVKKFKRRNHNLYSSND
ncbi:lariat debranching enzyme A [Cimex lectularius]|uniref:Lariat debranching enzyme C-terminal domain-containing protein n=1 Tax=Cimex lectularius TaxID=79782 RepID=A0A8I6SBF1_CIMLE|nr:lariat debranching enzyme A [Cimex lectularius]